MLLNMLRCKDSPHIKELSGPSGAKVEKLCVKEWLLGVSGGFYPTLDCLFSKKLAFSLLSEK